MRLKPPPAREWTSLAREAGETGDPNTLVRAVVAALKSGAKLPSGGAKRIIEAWRESGGSLMDVM